MFHNHSYDMFGLPPMRDYVEISDDFFADTLPAWAREYENCSGGSILYRFFRR